MRIRNNITCYVYVEDTLIAQIESALQLSKITGTSSSGISRCLAKGEGYKLYGKFTISRLPPTSTTFINALNEKELRLLFEDARIAAYTANENSNSIPISVINTFDNNNKHHFSSSLATAKFSNTFFERSVSHTTIRKLLNTQKVYKG